MNEENDSRYPVSTLICPVDDLGPPSNFDSSLARGRKSPFRAVPVEESKTGHLVGRQITKGHKKMEIERQVGSRKS